MTTIQYYTIKHFGADRMYIADPIQSKAFHTLTKRKIILPEHFQALKDLGITLEEVQHEKDK